jgi:hypothetical protein
MEVNLELTMTPQIPGYVIAFESTIRPLVAAIALGLSG